MFFVLDFADALANPIQYLSMNEKRTQQLEALLMDETEDVEENSAPKVCELINI